MSFLQYFDIHITILYLNLNLFVFCMFVAETAFFNLTESVKKEKTFFFLRHSEFTKSRLDLNEIRIRIAGVCYPVTVEADSVQSSLSVVI